jgi:hypothetical protein
MTDIEVTSQIPNPKESKCGPSALYPTFLNPLSATVALWRPVIVLILFFLALKGLSLFDITGNIHT